MRSMRKASPTAGRFERHGQASRPTSPREETRRDLRQLGEQFAMPISDRGLHSWAPPSDLPLPTKGRRSAEAVKPTTLSLLKQGRKPKRYLHPLLGEVRQV